jgi:hypothetical protein
VAARGRASRLIGPQRDLFIEELGRLVETSPLQVGEALVTMLPTYQTSLDYEDRLKKLILKLAENPDTRSHAIRSAETSPIRSGNAANLREVDFAARGTGWLMQRGVGRRKHSYRSRQFQVHPGNPGFTRAPRNAIVEA